MNTVASTRIPVCNGEGVIVERVGQDSVRARRLAEAPNATVVRKRRGPIVRILLKSVADNSGETSLRGNPRAMSHDHETDVNPRNVWILKHIVSSAADLFDTVVNELKTAA